MKKLRIILNCKIIYVFLFFILISKLFYSFCFVQKNSKYEISENSFFCTIDNYYIKGNQLRITLDCNEKIIGYYYFTDEKEVCDFEKTFDIGTFVHIKGSLESISSNNNFNTFNYREYCYYNNIFYNLKIESINYIKDNNNFIYLIKRTITNRIKDLKSASYIKAFILGDKSNIDNSTMDNYKSIGILHLLAVSGMHVNILISIINCLFKKGTICNFFFCLVFLIIYLFIVDSVSLLRSVIWFVISYISVFFEIKISLYKKLFFLLFIILFINPFYVFYIGFWYSFLISSAIILLNRKIKNKNYFIRLLYVSLISFLISLPINIYSFSELNLLSFFYNLVIVPFVLFLFPLSIIVFVFPILDSFFFFLISILENLSSFFSSINSTIIVMKPSLFIVIIYYVFIFLTFKNIKNFLFLFFLITIHFNYNKIFENNFLLFFDVGEGDSILIHNGNYNILVDTGGIIKYNSEKWEKVNNYSIAKSIIIPSLKSFGISKIDVLILTHGDYDHMGEAINLVRDFKIGKVIFNNGEYNDLELELIKVLEEDNVPYYQNIKILNIKNNKLYFLNNNFYDNENDNSIVLYSNINNYKFLLMGDAGINVEQDLIDKYNLFDIDILKVGHHGSNTSSSSFFINNINPKYSIISVGKGNRYGHPNKEILDILDSSNIYRTDIYGSIMFKFKKDGLKLQTYL